MFDRGSGCPLIVIPGIQGRWEWIAPALVALGRGRRVLSFSLCGEPTSGAALDAVAGFDSYVAQIDRVLDDRDLRSAAVCGISFGGLVAVRYAALRPERVDALVLASPMPPRWRDLPIVQRYRGAPWKRAPLFAATAPARLWPEIRAASPGIGRAAGFLARHAMRALTAPCSPGRMVQRLTLAGQIDFAGAARQVGARTLLLTGEPRLDRVVAPATACEYLDLIRGARHAVLDRTGHIGLVTRPDAFATIVEEFLRSSRE